MQHLSATASSIPSNYLLSYSDRLAYNRAEAEACLAEILIGGLEDWRRVGGDLVAVWIFRLSPTVGWVSRSIHKGRVFDDVFTSSNGSHHVPDEGPLRQLRCSHSPNPQSHPTCPRLHSQKHPIANQGIHSFSAHWQLKI